MRLPILAAVAVALPLAGCFGPDAVPVPQASGSPNQVYLVAVAPDGTRLWAVRGFDTVYFASRGAQWQEACGKNCSRTVTTPTAP